jgi:hypothetical protein
MLRSVIADQERALGPAHINIGFARGYLGMALAEAGKRLEALREMRAALDILVRAEAGQQAFIRRSISATKRLARIASAYVKLLSDIRGTELERGAGIDAVAEAFRMSDIVRVQAVQQAVAASAARGAADSPLLAALVRQEQDLTQEAEALYRILSNRSPRAGATTPQSSHHAPRPMRCEGVGLIQEIERRFPAMPTSSPKPHGRAGARRAAKRRSAVERDDDGQALCLGDPKTGAIAFMRGNERKADRGEVASSRRWM